MNKPIYHFTFARTEMGTRDRLTYQKREWIPAKVDSKGYFCELVADPDVTIFISHEELHEALTHDLASIDYSFFSQAQTKLRRVFGDRKLSECNPTGVALARYYEQLIHKLEEHLLTNRNRKPKREELQRLLRSWRSDIIKVQIDDEEQMENEHKAYSNHEKPLVTFPVPTVKTFLKHVKEYLSCGRDIRALVPRHHGPGRRKDKKVCAESVAFWTEFANRYASARKPSMAQLLRDTIAAIHVENEARKNGEKQGKKLEVPGRRRFETIIRKMDIYHVVAGRHGLNYARSMYRAQMTGFDELMPGDRIELDDYMVELQTWLKVSKIWDRLSRPTKAELRAKRIWLVVAVDAATGYVPAIVSTPTPKSAAVVEALDMMMNDRHHISVAVGAKTLWVGAVRPRNCYSDNGAAYTADATHDAFRDSRVGLTHPPTGQPYRRGFIESLFSQVSEYILGYFDGRTFSGFDEKGDYDSLANATLTADDFLKLFIRAILDIYHHRINPRTHETPHNAWTRHLEETGMRRGTDAHERRHIFGLSMSRKIQADGMYVWGIRYQSEALQALRLRYGQKPFHIRVHKSDIRWISVKGDEGWITVPNRVGMKHKIGLLEWITARKIVREAGKEAQKEHLPTMYEALAHLRESGEAAALQAGITPHIPSADDIRRLHKQLFEGLVIDGEVVDDVPTLPAATPTGDLLNDGLIRIPPVTTSELGKPDLEEDDDYDTF